MRRQVICFAISSQEKEFLEELAKAEGKSLSEKMREIVINYIIENSKKTIT